MDKRDTVCVMPWIGTRIGALGDVKPCCLWHNKLKHPDGTLYNIQRETLEDIMQAPQLKKLRQQMLDGERPKECQACWFEEDTGVWSKRQRDNDRYWDFLEAILEEDYEPEIVHWDINLGNTCNLKCRLCGAHSSSQWAQDIKRMKEQYGEDNPVSKIDFTDLKKVKNGYWSIDHTLQFWDDFFRLLKNTRTIELFGGEPLYQKRHYDMLEECINQDVAKNIHLHYNTNGTVYPDRYMKEVWPHFGSVSMMLSLDGVEERFEYMRHPASWKQVEENVKNFITNKPDTMELVSCPTSNVLSYYYMDELVDWSHSLDLGVWINLLHFPRHYNIRNYPQSIKDDITNRMTHEVFLGHNDYMQDEQWNHLDEFFQHTDFWDKWRGESFDKVFPELASVLRSAV